MPRVNINDVSKYSNSGGGGSGSYFSLKNDKDVKEVRFMLNDAEDLNEYIYAVHRVMVAGSQYERNVNCLRNYNDPVDDCPFCAAGEKIYTRLFLPLYDIDEDAVKIWERSTSFIKKMTSVCSRYKDLVSHTFEIERNGKPKDQKTTYEVYETGEDDTTLDDLPDVPKILGRYVMDKTAEDMEFYLDEGQFPPEDDEDEAPVRRRGNSTRNTEPEDVEEDEPPRRRNRGRESDSRERRTPNKGVRKRNEDKF